MTNEYEYIQFQVEKSTQKWGSYLFKMVMGWTRCVTGIQEKR